jgi:thiol:disulfide interchange protein
VLIGLAAVVTAFALSLFGVFSLNPPRAVNELGARVQGREGLASAFGTGLLATVLGTACTAPFLSAAVAVATGLARRGRHAEAFGVFLFAGLGMAMPYALLTWQPAWLKVLPRPGPWMEVFERAVGFVLLATVVWLLSPLAHQIGTDGLMATLVFLLVVAVAAWLFGRRRFDVPAARRAAVYLGLALMLGGGWFAVFRWWRPLDVLAATQWEMRLTGGSVDQFTWRSDGRIPWVPYTRARAEAAVQSGRTVFVDYTAEWCVNCKANEKLVLETSAVRSVMKELGVVPFKADFTSFDAEIRADLSRYGRSGVPMYLVIPANRPERATVLPEVLTVGVVVEALRAAGPSVEARVEPVAARP